MENLKGIASFVEAAKTGSFTRAAAKLDVSPQAVAGNIARLESLLGARLFNRTTRSLSLTAEGQRFLAIADDALTRLDEAFASVADRDVEPAGTVRISTGRAFGLRYLMPLLPALRARYPKIALDIAFDDRKVDLVKDGVDIGIRGGVIADSSLVTRHICPLSAVLVASPGYLAARGVPQSPEALLDHSLIQLRFANGTSLPWEFKRGRKQFALEVQGELIVSDPEAAADAALRGLGIAQVSSLHAFPFLKRGELYILLADTHVAVAREMVIHYPHRKYAAPRVKACVDFLLDAFAKSDHLHVNPRELAVFHAPERVKLRR